MHKIAEANSPKNPKSFTFSQKAKGIKSMQLESATPQIHKPKDFKKMATIIGGGFSPTSGCEMGFSFQTDGSESPIKLVGEG